MNKFLKLPLFLAVVGGICTAVLATTYAITNPIVVQRVQKEQFAAYFGAFDLLEADGETPKTGAVAEEKDITADLIAKGINKKVEISYNFFPSLLDTTALLKYEDAYSPFKLILLIKLTLFSLTSNKAEVYSPLFSILIFCLAFNS